MILTDEEIRKLTSGVDCMYGDYLQAFPFARAIEAAILAKLASAELPEPVATVNYSSENDIDWEVTNLPKNNTKLYTADQLRQAYAQGAAAQLSDEPFTHYRHYDEQVQPFSDEHTVPLYTRRQA